MRVPGRDGVVLPGLMFVEREQTPEPAMALGIRSHVAGLSLSNSIDLLTALGIHCSRKAIYEWMQKADRQPDAGQCPNHVAFDEPVPEKHHVETAVFLVDGVQHLQTTLHRSGLRFQTERHGNRNAVEWIFRELKR